MIVLWHQSDQNWAKFSNWQKNSAINDRLWQDSNAPARHGWWCASSAAPLHQQELWWLVLLSITVELWDREKRVIWRGLPFPNELYGIFLRWACDVICDHWNICTLDCSFCLTLWNNINRSLKYGSMSSWQILSWNAEDSEVYWQVQLLLSCVRLLSTDSVVISDYT